MFSSKSDTGFTDSGMPKQPFNKTEQRIKKIALMISPNT
ncbi:Uncharacterised protein [Vibrio cholerae]|nr:Uncharacterised protein [Vibrio cholerae]